MVLLDNLAGVAQMSGDLRAAAAWQRSMEEAEGDLPPAMRLAPFRWVQIHRAEFNLKEAARWAERILAEARLHLEPFVEDRFAGELGDLLYRMGESRRSYECYRSSLLIRRRVGDPADRLVAEMSCAMTASRAGLREEAEALLESALSNPLCDRPAAQADVWSALALSAARHGEGKPAEQRANRAIERAVESGDRNCLLRVARAAGEACLLLGRRDEAREAFTRAIEIAGGGLADPSPPPASEMLAAHLGAYECAPEDPQPAVKALSLLREALADPDTWWCLGRLLAAAQALLDCGSLPEGEPTRSSVDLLLRAAAQRVDAQGARLLKR